MFSEVKLSLLYYISVNKIICTFSLTELFLNTVFNLTRQRAEAEGQVIGSIHQLQNEEHQGIKIVTIGEIKSKISKIVVSLTLIMFQ
jgi:hypothetical protein